MYFYCLAIGAMSGALFRDLRALTAIFSAAAVLLVLGLRDHVFEDLLGGLGWFFGNLACFEIALVLSGALVSSLRRHAGVRRHKYADVPRRLA